VTSRHLGASYRFAVAVLRPPLQLLTRRDWRGTEHLPRERGFVVVANHLSYADPLTFAHFLFDNGCPPRFLAKESVFRLPVVGRIIAGAGQIPVYRQSAEASQAFAAATEAVREGECVAIYPEGTLTRDPDLWPMVGKTGAARISLLTGCPVVPVAQWGVQEILAPYGRRLRVLPRRMVHVWAGPPVDLDDLRGGPVDATCLSTATDRILDRMTALLAQIRGEQPPVRRWDPRDHGPPLTGDPRTRRTSQQAPGQTPEQTPEQCRDRPDHPDEGDAA
jgi:1-acyl-sn-glycerol-3-phosphate acyltransferase